MGLCITGTENVPRVEVTKLRIEPHTIVFELFREISHVNLFHVLEGIEGYLVRTYLYYIPVLLMQSL